MAASIDTNVLVRLVVNDDRRQNAAALRALSHYLQWARSLFVPITVALEFEWVLRSRYQFSKEDILGAFCALLSTVELAFEAENALEQALMAYEEGAADFADCLHIALARKSAELPFLTFDTAPSPMAGAKLLQ